jgi:hypothetical protein
MHLTVVPVEQCDHRVPATTTDLDTAVLDALGRAGPDGLPRHVLRPNVRARNQSLSEALRRLVASARIVRRADAWVRLPVPVPVRMDTPRNGNGNADNPPAPQHL